MSAPSTDLTNPQLDITSGPLRGVRNCCACGLPFGRDAQYGIIFTGSPESPDVVYSAHYDAPDGMSYDDEDDDGMTRRPCFDHLERTYEHELATAGIVRYERAGDSFTLKSARRAVDRSIFPADASGAGHACSVLLAGGLWARGLLSSVHGLCVQYAGSDGPQWGPGVETALTRPGAPADYVGSHWPYYARLQLGVDGGGPRWYLEDEPMHAGAPLEVFVGGAGWVRGRIETTEAGRQAHIYVAVAGGRYVILPADAAARRLAQAR